MNLMLILALGVVALLAVLLFQQKQNPKTYWVKTELGIEEVCPHCGKALGGQMSYESLTGAAAGGSSHSSLKINGKEICPYCQKAIRRSRQ